MYLKMLRKIMIYLMTMAKISIDLFFILILFLLFNKLKFLNSIILFLVIINNFVTKQFNLILTLYSLIFYCMDTLSTFFMNYKILYQLAILSI